LRRPAALVDVKPLWGMTAEATSLLAPLARELSHKIIGCPRGSASILNAHHRTSPLPTRLGRRRGVGSPLLSHQWSPLLTFAIANSFSQKSVDALLQAPYASTTATARGIRLDARLRDVGSCSESRPNRIAMPMGLRIVRTPLGSCQQSSWNWTMLWDVLDQLYSDW